MKTSVRPRPSDFRSTYIEVGKDGCIAHYRAHWKTVDRWVEEEGKSELRKERADYVRSKRPSVVQRHDEAISVDHGPPCDPDELSAACQYLRDRQGGSWRVGLRDDGCYFVGTATLVGSEVIERAKSKGMDEWYVEADMMKRFDMEQYGQENQWLLDNAGLRDPTPVFNKYDGRIEHKFSDKVSGNQHGSKREELWFTSENEDFYAPKVN